MGSTDYIAMYLCVVELMYVFGFVFVYCEIGHQLSSEFDTINDAFYELDWNSYPEEIKRTIPVILQVTQESFQLSAYGNYPCSRETFKKVNSTYLMKKRCGLI